jgi:hypothetical protein
MRLTTTVIGLSLSLSLGCVVDREIGSLDVGDVTTPGEGLPSPTRLPAPPPSNDPCCVVREQMALDSSEINVQASPPSVVRVNGSGWAVSWQEWQERMFYRPVIRRVAGDTPGPTLRLAPGAPDLMPTDLDHYPVGIGADGNRFALASQTWSLTRARDPEGHVILVDDQGVVRAETTIPGASAGGVLVRASHLRALAMIALDEVEGPTDQARLLLLDDALRPLGPSVDLGPSLPDDSQAGNVLALTDKLVTVIAAPDGVHVRSFAGRALRELHPEVVIDVGTATDPHAPLGRNGLPYNAVTPVSSVTATVVHDLVIIAAMNRLTVRTWVYQPATGSLLGGPTVVATSTHVGRLNVGGDTAGGTAALCYSVGGDGSRNPDGLQVAIVGPDGKPRGLPVTVASGLSYVATCDVAAGGVDEYLVTYWNAAKEEPRPSILANRLLVQRGPVIIE